MKLMVVFLFVFTLHSGAKAFGQVITLNLRNAPLERVIKEIEKQSEYSFIYSSDLLSKAKAVSIGVTGENLYLVLQKIFKVQPLDFVISDKFIVLSLRNRQKSPVDDTTRRRLITIKGIITDQNQNALQDATIQVVGTNYAVLSAADGSFELGNVPEDAVIEINYLGYQTVKQAVRNSPNLVIRLTELENKLDEVVVKGYYSTSRRLNTGNVSKVSSAIIEKQPITNPLQALQGRVAGVQIIQTTGVPGGGFTVRIRGRNNLRPNADFPLYIVDGVPYNANPINSELGDYITKGGNPLNLINPLDIESMEVLKDGDATSIYGSRGANGVILITTKKGRPGRTKVEVNVYSGVGEVARKMKLLNTAQYLEMRNEAFANSGLAPSATDYDLNGTWDKNRYTDWQDVLIGGAAKINNAQFALSGGTTKTQFYFGGGYASEGTVFPADLGNKRASAHFNLTHGTENGKFNARISTTYMNDRNDLFTYDVTNDALTLPPNAPEIYTADGMINWQNLSWNNPMATFNERYKIRTNNLISNGKFTYKPVPALQIALSAGYTVTDLNENHTMPLTSLSPAYGYTSGEADVATNDIEGWILEPQAEYSLVFGGGKLTALAGMTFQQNANQKLSLHGLGFVNDNLLENIQAAASLSITSFVNSLYKYNAFYGRLNYDFKQKYVLNITGRRDGSSRFGPGKQFANFGAIGAAWVLSNEGFMQRIPAISFAKIRGSYGTTGSDQIGDYGFFDLWNSTGFPYNGSQGLLPQRLFNRNYAWELSKKFEVALEVGLLDNRVYLNTSFYRNITPNQLILRSLPSITGFTFIQENFPAVVENRGFEIEANTINISRKSFRWTSNFNITIPKNTLLEFPGIESSSYFAQYKVGRSLFTLYRLHSMGVDPATGIIKYEDINGDGSISNTLDRTFLKETAQQYYAGLENALSYKGFELNFLFYYVRQTGNNYMNSFYRPPGAMLNQPAIVMNRWQKPGDVTEIQKFTHDIDATYLAYTNAGDQKIGDASYLRLKSFRLAWQLPERLMQKLKLQQFKFYIQGHNLLTFTNYIGLDPEAQDNFSLPPLRVITAGVQINL